MLPSWCNDSVDVWRAPTVAVRGTEERDWANAVKHTITGCSVQPSTTSTGWNDPREALASSWTLYAPPGADVRAGDRVDFDGASFRVDGRPMAWRSPTGAVSHVVAYLAEWEG